MAKQSVKDLDLKSKKVLVRADFNVPMKNGEITNDNRIQAALPTLEYILEQGGKVIVFSHLGRIKTEEDKDKNSLRPVSVALGALLGKDVTFVPETRGEAIEYAIYELYDVV